jgi:hypothetical protein
LAAVNCLSIGSDNRFIDAWSGKAAACSPFKLRNSR